MVSIDEQIEKGAIIDKSHDNCKIYIHLDYVDKSKEIEIKNRIEEKLTGYLIKHMEEEHEKNSNVQQERV